MRIIILILCLFITTLSQASDQAFLEKGKNVRVMPIGDSITLGKDSCLEGYRRVLYEWLLQGGYPITYVGKQNLSIRKDYPTTCSDGSIPFHEGYGSFRTDMILEGGSAENQTSPPLASTLETYKPNVVLLMIGTNDVIQNFQLDSLEQRLEKILDAIYTFDPGMTVLVASIAPIKAERFGEKETRVKAFNTAIPPLVEKQKAKGRKAAFVDIHATLEEEGLSRDGVHPDEKGYARMARTWYQALTGATAPEINSANPLLLPPPVSSP